MGEPARLDPAIRFAVVPRNLTRAEALAYLGWAPKLFDRFVRQGAIVGRRHGRNGAIIYSREQLDEVDRKRTAVDAPANDLDSEL